VQVVAPHDLQEDRADEVGGRDLPDPLGEVEVVADQDEGDVGEDPGERVPRNDG